MNLVPCLSDPLLAHQIILGWKCLVLELAELVLVHLTLVGSNQQKKLLLCSFHLFMRSTCTSCLRQRTRWSSQLGATQDGAALLRGRKSFRCRQRLCFLHLHGELNWSGPNQGGWIFFFTRRAWFGGPCTGGKRTNWRLAAQEGHWPLLTAPVRVRAGLAGSTTCRLYGFPQFQWLNNSSLATLGKVVCK